MLIVILLTILFWVRGLHCVAFIATILHPFWLQIIVVNSINFFNGDKLLFIGTEPFYQWFIWIGGSGATIGLVILIRYFSKSLGKEALKLGIFNINDQVIFGIPIVMSKKQIIPFIIIPCLFALISYNLIIVNFIQALIILVPWVLPFVIGSFISVGGMHQGIILTIGLAILSIN